MEIVKGQQIGLWTVIENGIVRRNKRSQGYCRCRCQCGKECDVLHYNLAGGTSRGCKTCRAVEAKRSIWTAAGYKVGDRVGRLTVISEPYFVERKNGRHISKYLCECECGKRSVVAGPSLKCGQTKSCGCLRPDTSKELNFVHGGKSKSGTDREPMNLLYGRWSKMRGRCNNLNDPSYHRYGGRGIKVCPEWDQNFTAFRDWAMANGYSRELEIDRKNNDGNYEPDNCRFVTIRQNNRNKSKTILLTAWGETKSVPDWADDARSKVQASTIRLRTKKGWDAERAISTPLIYRGVRFFKIEPEYYI